MGLPKNEKIVKVYPKSVHAESSATYKLSKEQLNFYNENGFLVVKGLIDFASLYNVKKRFINIAKGLDEKGYITVVREPALLAKGAKGEDAINKLQDIHFDDVFSTYSEDPKLLDIISQLIGDSICVMHSMFINKPPGTGRHPPHQDLYFFPFRPADKIVAAWTAVDHVTEENGCLYVIPKSHKEHTLIVHKAPPDSNKILYHGIADESLAGERSRVPLTMQPGDTALFHPLLLHGSGPNVSKNYRKSITCHYASGECYYVPVEGTVQESIAREIEAEARRRKLNMNFQDTWRFKSKVIRGVKSNL